MSSAIREPKAHTLHSSIGRSGGNHHAVSGWLVRERGFFPDREDAYNGHDAEHTVLIWSLLPLSMSDYTITTYLPTYETKTYGQAHLPFDTAPLPS